jgi:hypothetical protein
LWRICDTLAAGVVGQCFGQHAAEIVLDLVCGRS